MDAVASGPYSRILAGRRIYAQAQMGKVRRGFNLKSQPFGARRRSRAGRSTRPLGPCPRERNSSCVAVGCVFSSAAVAPPDGGMPSSTRLRECRRAGAKSTSTWRMVNTSCPVTWSGRSIVLNWVTPDAGRQTRLARTSGSGGSTVNIPGARMPVGWSPILDTTGPGEALERLSVVDNDVGSPWVNR